MYIKEVHTSLRSSQTSRRNASWALASREEAGLPSPRQSTLGDCRDSASKASRISSVQRGRFKFVGRCESRNEWRFRTDDDQRTCAIVNPASDEEFLPRAL